MFQVREQRMKTVARPSDQDLGDKQEFGETLGLGATGKKWPCGSLTMGVACKTRLCAEITQVYYRTANASEVSICITFFKQPFTTLLNMPM